MADMVTAMVMRRDGGVGKAKRKKRSVCVGGNEEGAGAGWEGVRRDKERARLK